MGEKASKNNTVSNVVCINCGNAIKEAWQYCPYCKGSIHSRNCPQCDQKISLQWNFCPHCQTRVNEKNDDEKVFTDTNEWLRAILKVQKT